MLLSKKFWKPVLWWNVKMTKIEYYDIQYAPDRTRWPRITFKSHDSGINLSKSAYLESRYAPICWKFLDQKSGFIKVVVLYKKPEKNFRFILPTYKTRPFTKYFVLSNCRTGTNKRTGYYINRKFCA